MNRKDEVLEFFGEIAVKGNGHNDLYASYGPDDDNILDQEGTVTNKPRCILISPRRID